MTETGSGLSLNNKIVPVAIAIAAVAVGLYYYYYCHCGGGGKKKKVSEKVQKVLCDPTEKYLLPLVEKDVISHDTRRFRFALPTPNHVLGLPVGQHVNLCATICGETVVRSYTPVSSDEDHGYVDMVIKVYRRNVNPKFPDGGKMSQHLDEMRIGDSMAFRGPSGKLQYLGDGKFQIKALRKDPPKVVHACRVNMMAGGTGITPMLQLIRNILVTNKGKDHTQLALIYANQTVNDILLREELDCLAKTYPDQFRVWYTLDCPTGNWQFSQGFISVDMVKEHLFPAGDSTLNLMCGPPPMITYACQPSLDATNHKPEMRFAY